MKLEQIKQELKRQKLFIYKNTNEYHLAKRTQDGFELITEEVTIQGFKDKYKVNPLRYLLIQCQNALLDPTETITDLKQVLPVIDFKVFTDYDARSLEIQAHKALLTEITGSKSIFNRKKNYKLVYIKSHNHLVLDKEQVGYYIVKDSNVVPVSPELLEEQDMKDAVQIHSVDTLRNALRDDMKNEYSEEYEVEKMKWEALG